MGGTRKLDIIAPLITDHTYADFIKLTNSLNIDLAGAKTHSTKVFNSNVLKGSDVMFVSL